MRNIQIIPNEEKESFRLTFDGYLIELSMYDKKIKFDENGKPIYKNYDSYFKNKDKYAFYFMINSKIVGFCFVRKMENGENEIAEFYLYPAFRGNGNASFFALEIMKLFGGKFVLSCKCVNETAIRFWDSVMAKLDNVTTELDDDNKIYKGEKGMAKIFKMHLMEKYFNLIERGEKVCEGRLDKGDKSKVRPGDYITFECEGDERRVVTCEVEDVLKFKNFDEMARVVNKKFLGFDNCTSEELVAIYRQIYSVYDEKKYGVLVYKIVLAENFFV